MRHERGAGGAGMKHLEEPAETVRRGRIDVAREGRRLDLRVDGISYSTFHPDKPWSGYVWDALAACGALVPAVRPRVLLLGCGAGTVLLLLRRLLPEARLLAVDADPRVLEVARARFGLDALGAEIVVADGPRFVRATRRRFDLVLDDMYAPGKAGLRRPVDDEREHLRAIARRLDPGGIAATNSTTDDDPPGLKAVVGDAYASVFPHVARLSPRRGYNVVFVGSAVPLDLHLLGERAGMLPEVDRLGLLSVRARRGIR